MLRLVSLPRFLGMANRMVAFSMMSGGRHIGFQDGRQEIVTTKHFLPEEQPTLTVHISTTAESSVLKGKRADVKFKELSNAIFRIETRPLEADIIAFFGDKVMTAASSFWWNLSESRIRQPSSDRMHLGPQTS